MERVTGIGGVFFRAKDPEVLQEWYATHLGLQPANDGCVVFHWSERESGANANTIWAPFEADTKYFGRPEQASMVNYRVRDLDAMLAQLRAAGVEVDEKAEESEYGKFGWATDPEGNRMEIWQPPAEEQ